MSGMSIAVASCCKARHQSSIVFGAPSHAVITALCGDVLKGLRRQACKPLLGYVTSSFVSPQETYSDRTCRKSRAERLLIRVLDKDMLSADEDLGSILLAVEDLTDGKQHELDIQLEGPQQPPSIQLRVQYLPLSGHRPPCCLSVAMPRFDLPLMWWLARDRDPQAGSADEKAQAAF